MPFAFYFVSQKEFQTSMPFVLTELVAKCGKNTEQLQFITKRVAGMILNVFLAKKLQNNLGEAEDFLCGQKSMNWI